MNTKALPTLQKIDERLGSIKETIFITPKPLNGITDVYINKHQFLLEWS